MLTRLLLCTCTVLIVSCGDGRYGGGIVIDEQGAALGNRTKAARDAERAITTSIGEVCGAAWQVSTAISDEPRWDDIAEDWRWSSATVAVSLSGSGQPPLSDSDIRAAIDEWFAQRMVTRGTKPTVSIIHTTAPQTPTAVVTSAPAAGWTYTLKSGDTLAQVSSAFYGTPEHWRHILDANPGLRLEQLPIGTVITVPPAPAP